MRFPDAVKTWDLFDTRCVDAGDPVVVVDDEGGDHRTLSPVVRAGTGVVGSGMGSRTSNRAPPGPGPTVTEPPDRCTSRCTRASPRPRRIPPRGVLVE